MLSLRQAEIVTGSLLGDGTIYTDFIKLPCKFITAQSRLDDSGVDKKHYLGYFCAEFIEFGCSTSYRKFQGYGLLDPNKTYEKYSFTTQNNLIWAEWEKKWYVPRTDHRFFKRRKIIPNDLKLTPLTLCIWHMDDGSVNPTDANLTLETQGFSHEEIDFLISRLKTDLDLKASIKKAKNNQRRIYIGRKHYFDYIEIIRPHVKWDCFKYKLDTTTYDKQTQIGEHHSQAKLSDKDAIDIFDLRDSGWLHSEIAKELGVSQSAITQILNGKRWGHLNRCSNPITKRRLTKELKDQIVDLNKKGLKQSAIAKELKIDQSTISRVLSKTKLCHV